MASSREYTQRWFYRIFKFFSSWNLSAHPPFKIFGLFKNLVKSVNPAIVRPQKWSLLQLRCGVARCRVYTWCPKRQGHEFGISSLYSSPWFYGISNWASFLKFCTRHSNIIPWNINFWFFEFRNISCIFYVFPVFGLRNSQILLLLVILLAIISNSKSLRLKIIKRI